MDKDWCMKMAKLEGDAEVGVGLLAIDPVFMDEKGLTSAEKSFRSIYSAAVERGSDNAVAEGICAAIEAYLEEISPA